MWWFVTLLLFAGSTAAPVQRRPTATGSAIVAPTSLSNRTFSNKTNHHLSTSFFGGLFRTVLLGRHCANGIRIYFLHHHRFARSVGWSSAEQRAAAHQPKAAPHFFFKLLNYTRQSSLLCGTKNIFQQPVCDAAGTAAAGNIVTLHSLANACVYAYDYS